MKARRTHKAPKTHRLPFRPSYPLRTEPRVSILRQLFTFLTGQIAKWNPELIIVVERKGTAILRALKEWEDEELEWSWDRVISSDAIDQMPDDYFRSKRIVIFDDMIKTGAHVRRVLSNLSERNLFDPANVKLAIFAVHADCPPEIRFPGGTTTYEWFYRELLSASYQTIQVQIVEMLQRAGSLMLDTEHIEVRLRLRNDFARLYGAVKRRANALVFRSSDQRTNISVLYPDDQAHMLSSGLFPTGTPVERIIKKCRIVDRGNDEYAIIPICFPMIPQLFDRWEVSSADRKILGESIDRSSVGRFHGIGLLAALEILTWALKDLAFLTREDITLSLPQSPSEKRSGGGYSLEHLRVVFPTLDLTKLTQRIAAVDRAAGSKGSQLRNRGFDDARFPSITNEELHRDSIRLLQVIRYEIDERILESELLATNGTPVEAVPGLTLAEIFDVGATFGWAKAKTSTICDILIDQAALSPDICSVEDEFGRLFTARTFSPAGEVVSEMVRRYTTQLGLPHGF